MEQQQQHQLVVLCFMTLRNTARALLPAGPVKQVHFDWVQFRRPGPRVIKQCDNKITASRASRAQLSARVGVTTARLGKSINTRGSIHVDSSRSSFGDL